MITHGLLSVLLVICGLSTAAVGEDVKQKDGLSYVSDALLTKSGLGIKRTESQVIICDPKRCATLDLATAAFEEEGQLFISAKALEESSMVKVDLSDPQKPVIELTEQKMTSLGGGQVRSGAMFPDFELPNLKGEMVKLSDYRGKRVLLVCWASW